MEKVSKLDNKFRTPKGVGTVSAKRRDDSERLSKNLEQASPESNAGYSDKNRTKSRNLSSSSYQEKGFKITSMKKLGGGLSEDSPSNWVVLGS